eukprot:g83213.t1
MCLACKPFDLIVGSDIIYMDATFPALLSSLRCLSAPSTLILLAGRYRRSTDLAFLQRAAESGFVVSDVPTEHFRAGLRQSAAGPRKSLRGAGRYQWASGLDGAQAPLALSCRFFAPLPVSSSQAGLSPPAPFPFVTAALSLEYKLNSTITVQAAPELHASACPISQASPSYVLRFHYDSLGGRASGRP